MKTIKRLSMTVMAASLGGTALTFGLVGHAQAATSLQFVVHGLTRTLRAK